MSAPRGIPPKSTKRSRQMMMTKAKANQVGISTTAKAIGAVAKLVPGGQVIGQVADVIGDVVGGRGQSPPQTPILKREPLTLHAIIINKSVPLDEAKKKAKEISRLRRKLFMRETTDSYRFRIIPKTRFKNFISKPISDTVTLVLGNLRGQSPPQTPISTKPMSGKGNVMRRAIDVFRPADSDEPTSPPVTSVPRRQLDGSLATPDEMVETLQQHILTFDDATYSQSQIDSLSLRDVITEVGETSAYIREFISEAERNLRIAPELETLYDNIINKNRVYLEKMVRRLEDLSAPPQTIEEARSVLRSIPTRVSFRPMPVRARGRIGGASRKRPTSALGERIKAIGRIADPSQREQAISDETARQEQENIISQERQAQKNIEDEDPTGVGRFSRNVLRPIGDVGIDLATKIPVVGEFLKPLKQIKDVAYGVTGGRRTGRERPTPPIPADIQEAIRELIVQRIISTFVLTQAQIDTLPIEILQRLRLTGTAIPMEFIKPAIDGIYENAYAYATGTLGLDITPKQFSFIYRPFMGQAVNELLTPQAEYAENQIQENQFEINQFIQNVALPALRPFYMNAGAEIASLNAEGRPFSTRDIFYLLIGLNQDAREAFLHYTRGLPLRISPDDIISRLSAENVLTNNIMAEIYDRFNPEFPRLEYQPEGIGAQEFLYEDNIDLGLPEQEQPEPPSEGTRSPSDIDLTDIPGDGVINTFTGEYPMGRARSDAITGDEEDEDEGGKDEEPDDDEDTKDEEQQ